VSTNDVGGQVINCSVSGAVTATVSATTFVGALVAVNNGTITLSQSNSSVSGKSAVGGLVGGIGYKLTGVGTFWQGFIAGAIAGGTAGAIAGYNAGAANAAAEAGQNLANVRMKPFHSLEFDDYNVCGFVFTIIGSYSQFVSGFGDAAIEYASIIAPQCFEGAPGVPTI
jgi:hypothetical protein